jgi:hypothetical protein
MKKLKPEKVVEMLKSEGIEVTPEKAALFWIGLAETPAMPTK